MSAPPSPVEPHHTSPDYRKTIRKTEYRLLSRIRDEIEKIRTTGLFGDAQLEEISVARGAAFEVDHDDPIDLEPRYFLPGPLDDMEIGISQNGWSSWPRFPPVDNHQIRSFSWGALASHSFGVMDDAAEMAGFCEDAAKQTSKWERHFSIPTNIMTTDNEVFASPEGRPSVWHHRTGQFFFWPHRPNEWKHDPNVPHAIATIYDYHRPRNDELLRSEIQAAICLLKVQMKKWRIFIEHRILPVLIVSFHNIFSARIVQAHVEYGKLIMRPSRLLNLHSTSVTPDAKLLIRWLNGRPVGDTRFPNGNIPAVTDGEGSVELETGAALPKSISVRH